MRSIEPDEFVLQKGVGVIALHTVFVQVIEIVRARGKSVTEPKSYEDVLRSNRSNNSRGDDRNARPVSGLDFWRAGPDGAAGFVQVAALGRRVSDRKASVNASPYRSCLNGLCRDRRRPSNRPVLIRATHPNGETGMSRNKASGYTLSNNDASIVLGMVARGDRDHDIAAWFGVNQGRNRRSKGGQIWNNCRGPGKSVAAQGATRHQGPQAHVIRAQGP